ncbi:unnamed protein product [Amoebophrya sp. A25]|nr:unnamed protein product [Amoebophrya sp. A25]|eukprot:GSA25T00017420001.1
MQLIETAVTLAPGESLPFVCDPCDLDLVATSHPLYGFYRCNCVSSKEDVNPHLTGTHLECALHVLPVEDVVLPGSGAVGGTSDHVGVGGTTQTDGKTRSTSTNVAELILNRILTEHNHSVDSLLLRIPRLERTKVKQTTDAERALCTFTVVEGVEAGGQLEEGTTQNEDAEGDEHYNFLCWQGDASSSAKDKEEGHDEEEEVFFSEPLITRKHLRDVIAHMKEANRGVEDFVFEDLAKGVQCVCLDVGEIVDTDEQTRMKTSKFHLLTSVSENQNNAEDQEDKKTTHSENTKPAVVDLITADWAYLSNDACLFLRQTFPSMKVLLLNQMSAERENSGGGMFNHRLLFGLDKKVVSRTARTSGNGELVGDSPHGHGDAYFDLHQRPRQSILPEAVGGTLPDFLIGEGFWLGDLSVEDDEHESKSNMKSSRFALKAVETSGSTSSTASSSGSWDTGLNRPRLDVTKVTRCSFSKC